VSFEDCESLNIPEGMGTLFSKEPEVGAMGEMVSTATGFVRSTISLKVELKGGSMLLKSEIMVESPVSVKVYTPSANPPMLTG